MFDTHRGLFSVSQHPVLGPARMFIHDPAMARAVADVAAEEAETAVAMPAAELELLAAILTEIHGLRTDLERRSFAGRWRRSVAWLKGRFR